MQNKEDPDKWAELKRLEVEYEKRRMTLVAYYESVRHAQQVQVDDIPLPTVQLPDAPPSQIPLPSDLPLLPAAIVPGLGVVPAHGILKKTSAYRYVDYYLLFIYRDLPSWGI